MKKTKKWSIFLLCLGVYASFNTPTETQANTSQKDNSLDAGLLTYDSPTNLLPSSTDIVNIPDNVLRAVILSTLGKPADSEITTTDMEMLTSLYLSGGETEQIASLSGLEYAINLANFNMMASNQVTDFSPLEALTNLSYVRLQGANVTNENFPDLHKNTAINLISLTQANVDDTVLAKLTPLTSLEKIFMEYNPNITTIAALKNLPNLKTLFIQFDGVSDFTVINDFPLLTDLRASGQSIGTTSPPSTIDSSNFNYQEENQTLLIPFSAMPNRLTNFDGYMPPFTTVPSETTLVFNGIQLAEERLQIQEDHLLVTDVAKKEFDNLASISYHARLNNAPGSYAKPTSFASYAISNGVYTHDFVVTHKPKTGTVFVHYTDENDNELASPDILTGVLGETYQTHAKEISGWIAQTKPESETDVFTDTSKKVAYIYKKELLGSITVRYLDEHGQDLEKPEVLNGVFNTPYETTKKEIAGWTLKQLPINQNGVFSDHNQEVLYIYQPKVPLLESIEKPTTLNLLPLITLDFKHPSFSNQIPTTNNRQTEDSSLMMLSNLFPNTMIQNEGLLDITAPSNNKKILKKTKKRSAGTVTIKYVDEFGHDLAPSETLKGEIGESFTASAKSSEYFSK